MIVAPRHEHCVWYLPREGHAELPIERNHSVEIHVAFNRWPLPRPRGALAAAYTPAVSRPTRDPLGVSSSRLGKNYQVRTILASAAYS